MAPSTVMRGLPRAWTQSVPSAVADGYVVDALGSNCLRRTHPLPRTVLTVSKSSASIRARVVLDDQYIFHSNMWL